MARKTKTIKITISLETWQKIQALEFCGLDNAKSLLEDAVVVRQQLFDEGCNEEYKSQYEKHLKFLQTPMKKEKF
jgi:hypothetical protein